MSPSSIVLPVVRGTGTFYYPCDAEVNISEVKKGSYNNAIQSIILPNPSGGTWTLTIKILDNDAQTLTLAYNINATALSAALAGVTGIGNVSVIGSGTIIDPFVIEFIGELSGVDIDPIQVNGTSLTGTPYSAVEKVSTGTKNERQSIIMASGNMEPLVIKYGGTINPQLTIPIEYNASINQRQAAIEALSNVGVGNINLTGGTTDRTIPYIGDINIDFIGAFAGQNVPQVELFKSDKVTTSTAYTAVTRWQGGEGTNDRQLVKLTAGSGTFTLTVFKPGEDATFGTTSAVAFNVAEGALKSAILSACAFLSPADISVIGVSDPVDPTLNAWEVEFMGAYAGVATKQMTINGAGLFGGAIRVDEVMIGSSISEQQLVTITKANAGYYTLQVSYQNQTAVTQRIRYNDKAPAIAIALYKIPFLNPTMVKVVDRMKNVTDKDVTYKYMINFSPTLGDVPDIIPIFRGSLLCDVIKMSYVPPGPYDYKIPEAGVDEDLSCQSGPLLTRPGKGDKVDIVEPCVLPESANKSTRIVYQRDLISPRQKTSYNKVLTVRDVVLLQGKNPNDFTPYLRDKNNKLYEVSYARVVDSGMSIVVVAKNLNTSGNLNRISQHLTTTKEILPSRYVPNSITK